MVLEFVNLTQDFVSDFQRSVDSGRESASSSDTSRFQEKGIPDGMRYNNDKNIRLQDKNGVRLKENGGPDSLRHNGTSFPPSLRFQENNVPDSLMRLPENRLSDSLANSRPASSSSSSSSPLTCATKPNHTLSPQQQPGMFAQPTAPTVINQQQPSSAAQSIVPRQKQQQQPFNNGTAVPQRRPKPGTRREPQPQQQQRPVSMHQEGYSYGAGGGSGLRSGHLTSQYNSQQYLNSHGESLQANKSLGSHQQLFGSKQLASELPRGSQQLLKGQSSSQKVGRKIGSSPLPLKTKASCHEQLLKESSKPLQQEAKQFTGGSSSQLSNDCPQSLPPTSLPFPPNSKLTQALTSQDTSQESWRPETSWTRIQGWEFMSCYHCQELGQQAGCSS